MSKSNALETQLLAKVFNNTSIPWDAITDIFVSLHTGDPGEGGDQSTSEATYASYARVAVARGSGGWTVSGNQAINAALIQFPQCTGGTNTISHVAVGTAATGTGQVLYKGALSSPLAVSSGIQPQFAAGALAVSED